MRAACSGATQLAAMARLRSRAQKAAPDLAAQAWAAWQAPPQAGAALHVVTQITCFEDLGAALGLAQLAALPGLAAEVTLCLPTPAAAQLCAQRIEAAGLRAGLKVARLPDPRHVITRLPPEDATAQIAADRLLLPGFVAALRRLLESGGGVDAAGIRLALAQDFETNLPESPLSQPLLPLLARPGDCSALRMVVAATRKAAEVAPFPGPRAKPPALRPPPAPTLRCYLNRGGGGNPVVRAFADAARAPLMLLDEAHLGQGIPVVWGVLRGSDLALRAARRDGRDFYYIDHAYFGRGHGRSYRITKNRFEAGPVREAPTDRLEALNIPLTPWRSGGREIIVCPPTEYFKAAHDCHDWLEQTLTQLKAHTDRPIVIREKPKPGETVLPLPEALETAHALVTHSSNVAIEAAVMGTPVFVSPSSAAAPVGLTDLSRIEAPVRPDRAPWLAHLAYSQFSLAEIRDGTAWRLLQEAAADG